MSVGDYEMSGVSGWRKRPRGVRSPLDQGSQAAWGTAPSGSTEDRKHRDGESSKNSNSNNNNNNNNNNNFICSSSIGSRNGSCCRTNRTTSTLLCVFLIALLLMLHAGTVGAMDMWWSVHVVFKLFCTWPFRRYHFCCLHKITLHYNSPFL